MKKIENYYLGLDIGTSSVGWAVTNTQYDILKFNGKYMWGTRLFPEANTAQERRIHRSSRRRLKRRKERTQILQMLFDEEISKIDPGFFQRLKDSKYYKEDKKEKQINSIFHDKDYSDREYYEDFPTIYHLRKFLLEGNKPKDIRFVYLALHHILIHRGHFLFPDMEVANVTEFSNIFAELKQYLYDEMDLDFEWKNGKLNEVEEILKDRNLAKSEKEKKLCALIKLEGKIDNQRKAMIGMMCGCKKKFSDLFQNENYKEIEINSFSFADSSYEEKRDELEGILAENILCLDYLKTIYDWGKLSDILQGEESISIAKVKSYEEHQLDLKNLKNILKLYFPKEKKNIFRKKEGKYPNYILGKLSQEEFNKGIKKILEEIKSVKQEDREVFDTLLKRASSNLLCPKQVIKENGVIPYQIHKFELERILRSMADFFPILKEKKNGKTLSEKIISVFTFRIPYYVGPLNQNSDRAWLVKNKEEKIYPWNFEEIVNLEESAEKFIQNLTNKCTYLVLEDVLPKSSLLYSKFMVLNELNNLKINGGAISIDLKQKIYLNLFQKYKKVTLKKLKGYLKSENIQIDENTQITGIDGDFKSSLSSYIDFYNILGDKVKTDFGKKLIENCILWITLYTGEKKLLKNKIIENYKGELTEEEIKKIVNLKYKDWGRLSYAFLEKIQSASLETGELRNIIQMMWETNNNLMQLLSSNYQFLGEIEKRNSIVTTKKEFDYETILGDSYASPSVKRMIWQSLSVVDEIKKIMKKAPEKIFIEMARQEDMKKERKESRKTTFLTLYKSIKEEGRDWIKEIENWSDSEFRSKKLYLYYTQMAKCMYTGEKISLDQLFNKNIYDIDHIYPRSKTKDDSIENMVLVKRNINADKKDEYPLEKSIQQKQHDFWKMLHSKKLIGDKKYERLTRTTEFTDEELSDFIARQLVETRQSTKIVADILKNLFPETKIVYVKANLTSDFRKNFKILKSRDINDYHHAHDAYLNIVTGNVYNIKFTDNPRNFIKDKKLEGKKYNLKVEKIFEYRKENESFWNPKTMVTKIENYIFKKRPQFTRYSFEQHGGFFDQNIVDKESCKKGTGYIPIKSSNVVLYNTSKYGGYGSVTGTYFFLVEHTMKGKRIRTIEMMPLYLSKKIHSKEELEKYCKEKLELQKPSVRLARIKYNSLLKINGFPYHITGKTNDSYWIMSAIQLLLSKNYYEYLRKLYIFCKEERLEEEIVGEKNIKLYTCILEKLEKSIYSHKLLNINYNGKSKNLKDILESEKENFLLLSEKKQAQILIEIFTLLESNNFGANLESFGCGKKCGITKINKNIDKLEEVLLINQSPTGLFENSIDLKKV